MSEASLGHHLFLEKIRLRSCKEPLEVLVGWNGGSSAAAPFGLAAPLPPMTPISERQKLQMGWCTFLDHRHCTDTVRRLPHKRAVAVYNHVVPTSTMAGAAVILPAAFSLSTNISMLFSTTLPAAVAVVCSLLSILSTAHPTHNATSHINYTTVTGYFLQDEPSTNPSTFDFTKENFGLLNRTYPSDATFKAKHGDTQWRRFAHQVAELNKAAPKNVEYKVFFMGRHGDGFHNDAEAFYGTPAWNCYYSELDGNSTVSWADAHLSPLGVTQALAVNTFWKSEIANQKIPTPQSYYTSPLTRSLQTANYTFSGLDLPEKQPFVPTVKELLREGISGHTCDRRNSSTYIHDLFPFYKIEEGFAETDPLWEALHGEPRVDQNYRSKILLDEVFESDKSTYISFTSHSGEISSILQVLGHRSFSLKTGAVIPVLVKAEVEGSPAPSTALQSFTPLCTCTSPPAVTATTSVCADPTPSNGEIPNYPSSKPS